jgi:hypothetical protein
MTGRRPPTSMSAVGRAALATSGHRCAELWVAEDNPSARVFHETDEWEAFDAKKEALGGTEIVEVRYVRGN